MTLRCEFHQDFSAPLERVFEEFADHEKLGRILGVPMKRIVDGSGEGGANGVGSVRRVGPAAIRMEETIVAFEPNRLIEYRITKGAGVKNHLGRMEFRATPSGCRLDYVITFEVAVPLLGPLVQRGMQRMMGDAIAKHARR